MLCDKCVYKTKGCTKENKENIILCGFFKPEVVYCKDCKKAKILSYGDCCICQKYGIKELEDFCSDGKKRNYELTADDILNMPKREFVKNRERILDFIKKLKGE